MEQDYIPDNKSYESDNIMLKLGVIGNALFKFFLYIITIAIYIETVGQPNAFYMLIGLFIFFSILWNTIANYIKLDRYITRKNKEREKLLEEQKDKAWVQTKIKEIVENPNLTRKDKIVRLTMLVHDKRKENDES